MSRQIAPVTELMLGCQIFVTNFTYRMYSEETNLMVLRIPPTKVLKFSVELHYLRGVEWIAFWYTDVQYIRSTCKPDI